MLQLFIEFRGAESSARCAVRSASAMPLSSSKWVREEDKIDCAHEIGNAARRTRWANLPDPQGAENILDTEFRRSGDTCVMPAKRVQPMRIGCGDQWLAKS